MGRVIQTFFAIASYALEISSEMAGTAPEYICKPRCLNSCPATVILYSRFAGRPCAVLRGVIILSLLAGIAFRARCLRVQSRTVLPTRLFVVLGSMGESPTLIQFPPLLRFEDVCPAESSSSLI